MATKPATSNAAVKQIQHLKFEVAYRARLQKICNKINAAEDLDEILIDLKDDITSLFAAERITLYIVDGAKRELVSRLKSGREISEIRLPISGTSSRHRFIQSEKNCSSQAAAKI